MRIRYSNGKTHAAVVAEASEWFIDFRAGDVDGEAKLRFIEWLRRSSEPVSVDITEVFSELRTPASDDPPDQAVHAQQIDELERILAHLPVRVATALVLHRVAGYSVQEVGDELGVSRETAKKYLARAVEHCRNLRAAGNIKCL